MSLAPAAYLLYQKILRHDPADPLWPGRDRFVLSCGHSSLTLYIQLYLSGYGLTLDDLEHYRTWGSRTPGHPEHHLTPGVETTTGPLGQGIGNAVGMARVRVPEGLRHIDAATISSTIALGNSCCNSDARNSKSSLACGSLRQLNSLRPVVMKARSMGGEELRSMPKVSGW